MDLRQLDAVVAVADHGTFSAAAEALHTVQSNVSSRIAKLERELDVVLIDRAGGSLTVAGEMVVERARRVHEELVGLLDDVASLRSEVVGLAHLGVIGTTGRWIGRALFAAMREQHPRVELTLIESTTAGLLPQLSSGQIDLAVVNLPLDDPEFDVEPLFDEELILLCPTTHPLAELDALDFERLDGEPIIMGPPTNAIRTVLEDAATERDISLVPLVTIDGIRLTASLVIDGLGPAVLPATALSLTTSPEVVGVPIADAPVRRVGLARRARSLPSAPARALGEVVTSLFVPGSHLAPGVHGVATPVMPRR